MEKLINLQIAYLVFTALVQVLAWANIFYAAVFLHRYSSFYQGRRVVAVLSILVAMLVLVWGATTQYMTAHQDFNAILWFSGCAAGVGIVIGIAVMVVMKDDYQAFKYRSLY